LPHPALVCYKRYMRKWMSERLKRRKKGGETPAEDGSKKQEPLQPRFYDDEPAAVEAAPAGVQRAKPEPAAEPAPTGAVEPAAIPGDAPAAGARPRITRRRRGRGGRGASRPKKAGGLAAESGSENSTNESNVVDPGKADTGESSFTEEGDSAGIAAGVPARVPAHSGSSHARSVPKPAPAPSAPAQISASSPRPSKGTVVLAIGLPGSGKSSWFKRHNIHPLSSDLLRELLFDDPQEQRFQDLIFSNLRSMLKARLIARRPMNYVDATNLTPHDRHSWIKLAKDYGYDVQGVFFDVPLDVCMERHQRRGRVVPEDVMRKMAAKLRAPTFEEGFSKITVVRVKQKDKE
jgi:predicted kinase